MDRYEKEKMVKEEREAIESAMKISGIKYTKVYELVNQYWGDCPTKYDVSTPWYLFITEIGHIVVGWRKRVLNVDWSETKVRKIVTEDQVTKAEDMVHAYSYLKLAEYLTALK